MCLRTKGMPESTAIFSVEAAGQVYNQTNEFVHLEGNVKPLCRPVHRGRPAHMQRMVQLLEVHPRTVRPTERSPRAQNSGAQSRCTRDSSAVRLLHVEPARVPLRHAAPNPPQLAGSLRRLARRPPDFLSGRAYQDGKWEHRGDFRQVADLVRGICGAHGGYETVEVRYVCRIGGGRGLRGVPEKRVDVVFPMTSELLGSTPTSGRFQPRIRRNGARRREKGRNVSWRKRSLQRKPGLDYGLQ